MILQKRFYTSAFALLFALGAVQYVSAQVRAPRPSQKASVMQTIGVTDVSITYSRPAVKGRVIWGDAPAGATGEATLDNQNTRPKGMPIVPYGHVWSFDYDEKKDTLRIKAKPEWVNDNQESLEYSFDPVTDSSATVNIRWEKIRVPFTVEVKDVNALALTKAGAAVAAAKPDDWRTPLQAASFAFQNKHEEEGNRWLDQSIKVKETFQNLSSKAQRLLLAGKM